MAIFGIDISGYQGGIDLSEVAREGFSFVVIKATEGDNYVNPSYASQVSRALSAGLLVMSYHFVHATDVPGQLAELERYVDKRFPVWLDSEVDSNGEYIASVQLHDQARRDGWNIVGDYFPRWFWSTIGSPDLRPLGLLWSSGYPGGLGAASSIYNSIGGDSAAGWNAYGGVTPTLYQFTDKATVAGLSVDASAFRGSLADLENALTMAITQDDANLIATTIMNFTVPRQGGQSGNTNLYANLGWYDANAIGAKAEIEKFIGDVAGGQNVVLNRIDGHTTPPLQVNATAQVDPAALQTAVQAAVQAALPAIAQAVQAALDAERTAQLNALGYVPKPAQ